MTAGASILMDWHDMQDGLLYALLAEIGTYNE